MAYGGSIACPLCGMNRMKPDAHVPSTPWVDTCGCCDQNTCFMHKFDVDVPLPKRPPEEEMLKRAQELADRRMVSWLKMKEAFDQYRELHGDSELDHG